MSRLFPVPTERPKDAPRTYLTYFDQRKWWRQRDGEWFRIKDMHPQHRANAAAWLLRHASPLAAAVSWLETEQLARWITPGMGEHARDAVEEAVFRADEVRTADPEAWIESTKLYRSLIKKRKSDGEN